MTRTRVALVLFSRGLGGVEQQVRALAHGIDRERFEVVVVGPTWVGLERYLDLPGDARYVAVNMDEPGTTLGGTREPSAEAPRSVLAQIAIRLSPHSSVTRRVQMGFRLLRLGPNRRRLRVALRELRPDVVHVHNGGYPAAASALASVLAARDVGVPIRVLTVHSSAQPRAWAVERLLDQAVSSAASTVTVVGRHAASALVEARSFPPEKVRVVSPGIPTIEPADRRRARQELEVPDSAILVGMIANFLPGKDQALLLRAFASTSRRHPEARLVFVGDGPTLGTVERLGQTLEVSHRVRFTGRRRASEILGALDLFVLASQQEGVPISILEAMSVGLPVVATDVGSVSDAVDHGRTGWLVAPNNVDAMQEALEAALADPTAAQAMGVAGREHFTCQFTEPTMIEAFQALYAGGA